jgi:hypothetical protein
MAERWVRYALVLTAVNTLLLIAVIGGWLIGLGGGSVPFVHAQGALPGVTHTHPVPGPVRVIVIKKVITHMKIVRVVTTKGGISHHRHHGRLHKPGVRAGLVCQHGPPCPVWSEQ